MSTFGKKALIWWDYHNHDRSALLRFNNTPKNLQIQILEKWYPIGMSVGLGYYFSSYEIIEYVEHLTYFSVKVCSKSDVGFFNKMSYIRNPLVLYPSLECEKRLKRLSKLDRLL